jgi:hypothetical protein
VAGLAGQVQQLRAQGFGRCERGVQVLLQRCLRLPALQRALQPGQRRKGMVRVAVGAIDQDVGEHGAVLSSKAARGSKGD